MSDNNETPNHAAPSPDEAVPQETAAPPAAATPSAAPPAPVTVPAKGPRLWPASTVIAGGVATALLSGLIGGFIGAALDDSSRPGLGESRLIDADRNCVGGPFDRMPPGGPGGPGGHFGGPGQQSAPGGTPG